MLGVTIAWALEGPASAGPLDEPASEGPQPGQCLAGLSLALRAVLMLQKHGVHELLLLLRPEHATLAKAIQSDPRVRLPLRTLEVAPDAPVLSALREAISEPFLLARYDRLASDGAYRALLAQPIAEGEAAIAMTDDKISGPLMASSTFLAQAIELPPHGPAVSPVVCHEPTDIIDVSHERGQQEALTALFNACRKPVDGLVSRHLNRHVSLFISRRLVNTAITPNAMTLVTFSTALVAAYFAVRGDYTYTLAAAALMQLGSILDGCDGELARVRFQGSKLGEWLDTIGDDASNVIFWAALGFGARSVENIGPWLALCGWVTAAANGLAALLNYWLLARAGRGDFYVLQKDASPPPPGLMGGIVSVLSLVLKQDFFLLFVLLLALAGVLHQALPLMALGALVTLGASLSRFARAPSRGAG